MRKKLLAIILTISVLVSSTLYLSNNKVEAEKSNGYRVEEVFSDQFNKKNLDSSWKLNDASLKLDYCGLHCISPVGYGSGPIINGFTLSNKTQINFTIYPQSGQTETNISFNIGMASPSSPQKEPDVDCKVQFWNDQLVFTNWQNNLQVDQSMINEHVLRGFNGLFSALEKTDITLVIERKSLSSTLIYAEYYRDGKQVYSSKETPFELKNPRYPNGYCGFFWDVVEMDVTNFEVYNNDLLVFEDDLSENTLTYPSTDYKLGNFHVNDTLNESKIYVSRVSTVLMDSENESIVNKNTLVRLNDVTNPYELTASIKVNELKEKSFFGFGFGLSENDNRIDTKNAIGFIKKDALTAEVVLVKNGVVDRTNAYQIALTKLGNGKALDYSIKLDAANNAYLTVNGLTYTFSNIDFYGEIGMGLIKLEGATESSSVELAKFLLNRNVFVKNDSEDASNNFEGTYIPDEENPLMTAPYINNQKYYIGSNVSFEEDWSTGLPALNFINASAYSAFGYAKPYSEWIIEFDIDVASRQPNQFIGIAFGKQSLVDVLVQASASNKAMLFRCDGNGGSSTIITYGSSTYFEDGTTTKASDINIFNKNNTKYHLMFVGKNRSVSLYCKGENDPVSDLGILRAKITNVNIDGYVSIVGNENVSFEVKNFKMVNLSDDCTKESELTLRESFDSSTVSNKIALDDMSKVNDGKLSMNNSSVTTTSKNLFGIIRFTLDELEDNLKVMLSTDKQIEINKANNQIIIREGGKVTTYDCSDLNLAYPKGKRFEIIVLGNKITIGFKSKYDPQDKLSNTIVEHTLSSELEEDFITIASNGKAVIDDLYIFSLDNSKECLKYDYEDDPNNEIVWKVKPDFDPSKVNGNKGCNSSISAVMMIIPMLGIIPAVLLKKREEE